MSGPIKLLHNSLCSPPQTKILETPSLNQGSATARLRPGVGLWGICYRAVQNYGDSNQNNHELDWLDIRNTLLDAGGIDEHNPLVGASYCRKTSPDLSWVSDMMTYNLQKISMNQTFVVLLWAGLQNNASLKLVHSAKKIANPGLNDQTSGS